MRSTARPTDSDDAVALDANIETAAVPAKDAARLHPSVWVSDANGATPFSEGRVSLAPDVHHAISTLGCHILYQVD